MSATQLHQDPSSARVGTVRALFRLREYAGPALPFIVAGMVAALIAQLIALAIPQVLQAIVDGPLADGDASAIWPFAGLVFGLGVLEAGMIALRRWFVLTPGTRVEARMRNALYAKLQDLPVSFHDRWPSGQLLSRAVSDLGLIRRWLSFGLVLLVVNLIVILVGLGILVSMNWMLGLVFLVCSIPLWVVGYRFEGRYSEVSRRSQDQAGDLATAVEESVHGIRVLKAFGRGKHALSTFRAQAESLRSTEIEKARLDAGIWTWILVVPTVALAVCLVLGVWLAVAGRAHRRRARRVLRHGDRAGVADRVDRVPARLLGGRAHRDRPVLRHPRQRERDHRPRAPGRDRAPEGRARLQRRAVPLPGLARPVRRPDRRRRPRRSSRARPWRSSASPAAARPR